METIEFIVSNYDKEYIKTGLNYFVHQLSVTRNIRSRPKYLLSVLKNNYGNHKALETDSIVEQNATSKMMDDFIDYRNELLKTRMA